MSFLPWYMHLPYEISLPLQMCTRNRISPPKNVHKSHIEMKKLSGILSRIYSPPFFHEQTKGQGEMRPRVEGTTNMIIMHEGCEMNEKMKFKPKTKKKIATKHRVNMTCQDEETRYKPMHDKGSKGVCKRQLCAMHNQSMEDAHVG